MGEVFDSHITSAAPGVGQLIGRVRAELLNALEKELCADARLAALEVSPAQFVIIAALADPACPKSATHLCKAISYDMGAMSRMLDRLEVKGLVRRVPNQQDRRYAHLELTPEGKAMYPQMSAISLKVRNRFLRGFTSAEVQELEALLLRLLHNGDTLRNERASAQPATRPMRDDLREMSEGSSTQGGRRRARAP